MKKYLLPIIGFFLLSAAQAHAVSWNYYRAVVVTSSAATASGTNINFPMLVSSTISSWATVSNGGRIQNTVTTTNGGQEAADLVFSTSTTNCINGNYLNFETEKYTSSTGNLIAWINVPSMASGTVVYACYGNAAISTDQSHASATWNQNYQAVYHLTNTTGTINGSDSTLNLSNLVASGTPTAATGTNMFGAGVNTRQGAAMNATLTTAMFNNPATVSAWVFATAFQTTACPSCLAFAVESPGEIFTGDASNVPNNNANSIFGTSFTLGTHLATGTWYFITNVKNGTSSGGYRSYLNGILDINTTSTGSPVTSTALMIGNRPTGVTAPWTGVISETRLSSAALSTQWILTEYNNQYSPSTFYSLGNEEPLTTSGIGSSFLNLRGSLTIKGATVNIK